MIKSSRRLLSLPSRSSTHGVRLAKGIKSSMMLPGSRRRSRVSKEYAMAELMHARIGKSES